jgi:DHA1 family inner membrane transport protein
MQRRQVLLLSLLSSGAFLCSASSVAIAPFLLAMAQDLTTDLAAIANLVAFQSMSWGVASLFAGGASDRFGRKPLLVLGMGVLAGTSLAVALVADYPSALLWRVVSGIGGGMYMGAVFATAADQVPSGERGRAIGWVITGQSLSLLLGVPLMTLLGLWGGWRGALAIQGVVTGAATLAIWLVVPAATPVAGARLRVNGASLRVLGARTLMLVGAGGCERVCYAAVVVFLPTFLLAMYGLSLVELALGLAVVAAGNLVGNAVGSVLSDRLPSRLLTTAVALFATAVLAVPVLMLAPGVVYSIVLGFAYTFADAVVRPPRLAALTDVSASARGAVLGLTVTFASLGWIAATIGGGWLIAGWGFGALGALASAAALLGTALALLSWASPAATATPLLPSATER